MTDESLAVAIRERADVVGQLTTYIGLFEWCAVSVSKRRPVVMWFGEFAVDVLQVFCPSAAQAMVCDQPPLNIIASVVDEGLTLMAQGLLPNINHYMAAIPLKALGAEQGRPAASRDLFAEVMKTSAKGLGKQGSDGTGFISDAYREIGLLAVTTAGQGDCGPDASCCLELRPRDPGGWKQWREELRAFIYDWSNSEQCQQCFKVCQEVETARGHSARRPVVAEQVEVEEDDLDLLEVRQNALEAEDSGDEDSDGESSDGEALPDLLGSDSDGEALPDLRGDDGGSDDEDLWGIVESDIHHEAAPAEAEPLPEVRHEQSATSSTPEGAIDVQRTIEKMMGHCFTDCTWEQIDRFRECRQVAVNRIAADKKRRCEGSRKHRRLQTRMLLSERIRIGEKYLAFQRAARKRGRKKYLKAFIKEELGWTASQKNKDFVVRCSKVAVQTGSDSKDTYFERLQQQKQLSEVPGGITAARLHRAACRGQKRKRERYVVLSFQGRPRKAPVLSELVFQWFVDIRGSIKGRLPTRTVLCKARQIAIEYFKSSLRMGEVPRLPRIDKMWIWRWKRQHGVSFRKPNRRYKVSMQGLRIRLRIFWLNNIKVRYFSQRLSEENRKKGTAASDGPIPIAAIPIPPATGSGTPIADPSGDIGQKVDMADQKAWHANESGSKELGTLEVKGAERVPLKENHAATRMRSTLFTWCTTVPEMLSERKLPLEMCFKFSSTGERVIKGITLPDGSYSVRGTSSGSYKEVHVFLFLEEHLPKATPERQRTGDWRLLYLDLYAGHLSRRLWDLCWGRMYVLLYHGGGCTGLTQWNDTWLHWLLEQKLLDVEQAHFNAEMLLRPHKIPSINRQAILDNAVAVWETLPHERSLTWAKKTGVSIALDGKEDTRGKT